MRISLESARVNANMSQKRVADELNISVPTLRSWEKGKSTPRVTQFAKLCELYSASMGDIILPNE